jgi:hypothetical protein
MIGIKRELAEPPFTLLENSASPLLPYRSRIGAAGVPEKFFLRAQAANDE